MKRNVWTKSARCETSACLSVMFTGDTVRVRDDKHPDGPVLTFTVSEWREFEAAVRNREFHV